MIPIVNLQPIAWKRSLILVTVINIEKLWQDPLTKCMTQNIFHGYKQVYSPWQTYAQETCMKSERLLFAIIWSHFFLFPCIAWFSSKKKVIHMCHISDLLLQDRDQECLYIFEPKCSWALREVSRPLSWLLFASQIAATDKLCETSGKPLQMSSCLLEMWFLRCYTIL